MEEISLKFDFHGLKYVVIFPTKKRALKSDFGWRSYAFSSDVTAGPMFGKFPYVYAVGYHQSIPRKFILATLSQNDKKNCRFGNFLDTSGPERWPTSMKNR